MIHMVMAELIGDRRKKGERLDVVVSVREYVFYVFFRFQKNMTFYVFFEMTFQKKRKKSPKVLSLLNV